MLIAALEGKIIIGFVLAVAALAAMIIYLPVALVREATRSDDEILPEWMGTARSRRNRLRVIMMIFGGLAIAVAILANSSD